MKQDNGSQVYHMLDKTYIKNSVGYKNDKEKKIGFNQKNKSPIKNFDNEDENKNNSNKKRMSNDLSKVKSLEEENLRLKNRIKVKL